MTRSRVDSLQETDSAEQKLVGDIHDLEIEIDQLSLSLTDKNPQLIAAGRKPASLQEELSAMRRR